MKDGLLIISSSPQRQVFLGDILAGLRQTHRHFFLRAKSRRLLRRARREHWPAAKTNVPVLPYPFFFIFLPFLWLWFGVPALIRLWRWKPNTVLLVNWPEKLIYTSIISWTKSQIVWLEYPDSHSIDFGPLAAMYKSFAKKARISVFCKSQAALFVESEDDKSINIIKPASTLKIEQQDTLFKNLANSGAERGRFVIGAVLYGLPKAPAEQLLSALSIAQSICPVIELVIIGEGKNRKHIQWTIKRLGLEKKVWLAGASDDFPRWASHLDVYAVASARPTLDDAGYGLAALAAHLPLICQDVQWMRDIVDSAGCFVNMNDPEAIASELISLQQDEERRIKLSRAAKRLGEEMTFEKSLADFTHNVYNE